MASQALIVAHENVFNRAVLGEDAYYFRHATDIAALLNGSPWRPGEAEKIRNNLDKIKTRYSWEHIADQLETTFANALERSEKKPAPQEQRF